jgi:catalase
MVKSGLIAAFAAYAHVAQAACPFMEADTGGVPASHPQVKRADGSYSVPSNTDEFMAQFEVNDTDVYMTSNTGTPIEDQESLSAGERGPTLLEDFIFREKIMHFGTVAPQYQRKHINQDSRPRESSRASSPCTRSWCSWCFHVIR